MWIITNVGLLNTVNIDSIYIKENSILSRVNGRLYCISDNTADFDKIIEAVKNNKPYVEVSGNGR